MTNIIFLDNFDSLKKDYMQWFDVPSDISKKFDFILSIEKGLDFPVGGENWDSLSSNIQDDETYQILEKKWGKKIMVLAHRDLPSVDENDFKKYIKIMNELSHLFDKKEGKKVLFGEENVKGLLQENENIKGFLAIFREKDRESVVRCLQGNLNE